MRNLLGIIGNPLGHSLSPILHKTAIEKLTANYKYEKWELAENELGEFIQKVKDKESNILGFNVTIPYKEKIIPYLDEIDILATKLNAVNTVKYENGKLKGYNTDGLGLFESLIRNNVQYEKKNILILGSGGACKGIAMFLTQKKVARIDIAARNENKVEDLISRIQNTGTESDFIPWSHLMNLDIVKYNIVIQTTPLGMKNQTQEIDFPYDELTPSHTVIDIVYNPLETGFLKKSKNKGATCINGLEMLVYQGYHSFKIWTGLDEDTDLMLRTANSLLEVKSE
jgi:shikimate dehydrogenase